MEAPSILPTWSSILSYLVASRRLRGRCQSLPASRHGFRHCRFVVAPSARLQVNGNTAQPSPQSGVRLRPDLSNNYLRHCCQRIVSPRHSERLASSSLLQQNVEKVEGMDLLPALLAHARPAKTWKRWKLYALA